MELQLDRHAINKYYSWNGLGTTIIAVTLISLFLGLMWFVDLMEKDPSKENVQSAIFQGAVCFGITWVLLAIIALLIGYYNFWRYTKVYSEKLHVAIEGPYLRIIECRKVFSDRKIHFNQLMDYTIIQDVKMKHLNMKSIRIGTNQIIGNGIRSYIDIPGVVNAEIVRDNLANYDFQHEKES